MTLYPRSRFLRYTVYFVCFALVSVALDMLWAQSRRVIHPRYDTTRIIEPIMPDGSIDYLTAIEDYFSRGATADNNAVPLLLEAMGRAALPKTQPVDGITSRLGMPHLPEQGEYFVTFADFTKARDGKPGELDPDPTEPPAPNAAPSPPAPTVVAWLAANEKPLLKVRQATTRPRYFLPFNGGSRPDVLISILLPHLSILRDVTRALAVRATARLTTGDLAGAREDRLTLHRLARLLAHSPTLVERAFAISAERGACYADQAVAASGKISAADLRAYAADLAALPDLDPPGDAIDMGERFLVLDATQHLARLSPAAAGRMYHAVTSNGDMPPPQLFPFLPIPYEQSMIDANAWYDGLLTAFRQPTYAQRRDALKRWEQGVNAISTANRFGLLSPDWALTLFLPTLNRFQTRWETARAENRLTQVALLLAAYKVDHNAYPATLAESAPADPTTIPNDNFSDRPLIYTRANTGCALYSVGPNATDDAGGGDDISVSLK